MAGKSNTLEEKIIEGISYIRSKRSRPCYNTIFSYIKRGGEIDLEMPSIKSTIDCMISNGVIYDGGINGESFYLKEGMANDNLVLEDNVTDKIVIEKVLGDIDDTFYDIIFDKIQNEVKSQLNLLINDNTLLSDQTCFNKSKDFNQVNNNYDNDPLIKTLKDNINYLKEQIATKDKIIDVMVKQLSFNKDVKDTFYDNSVDTHVKNNRNTKLAHDNKVKQKGDKNDSYNVTKSKTKNDKTKNDKTKNDKTKNDKTKNDKTKSDKTKSDKTKSDKTNNDKTNNDKTNNDKTNNDKTNNDKTNNDKLNNDHTFNNTSTSDVNISNTNVNINNDRTNNSLHVPTERDNVGDNFTVVSNKSTAKKKNNRVINILGDSILKDLQTHKMKRRLAINEKLYVKCFPGATLDDMMDYARPTVRKNPDLIVLHAGTNELKTNKTAHNIASDIIKLGLELKSEENDVMISSIVCRNDALNDKGKNVNNILKSECEYYNMLFIEHSNIFQKQHLNGSGLHLNYKGTVTLANNFLTHIKI